MWSIPDPTGSYVTGLTFSPDGRTLVAAAGSVLHLWDAPAGRYRVGVEGDLCGLDTLAVSPDGALLATGSPDGTIRLWPAEVFARD